MIRAVPAAALLLAALGARGAELEAAYGYDHLDGGRQPWHAAKLALSIEPVERAALEVGARGTERFGLRDLELGAGVRTRALPGWALGVEGTVSPTHRVLPVWSATASASRELGAGLVAGGGLRWSEYRTAEADSDTAVGNLGLEWYWRSLRLAWTGYLAGLRGAWAASGRLALDRFYGEEGRIGLALAAGRELENTGAQIVSTPVLSAGVAGRQPLGAGWTLAYELTVQRQGDLYTRTGAALGIRRRF